MIGIEKPKIETEGITPDGTYGKFIVEPPREVTERPSVTPPAPRPALFASGLCYNLR